jgi:competence protein ComEA
MTREKLTHRIASLAGIALLVATMGGTWSTASASPTWSPGGPGAAPPASHAMGSAASADEPATHPSKSTHRDLTGKLNLNTANEDQLMLLPTVGPAKAERIVTWRKKNGGFKRTADLRHVKGFGYKTFKRLEPWLDIKGDTTLAAK